MSYSELVEKQDQFVAMFAIFLLEAQRRGYVIGFGDGFRDSRVTYGHPRSLHRLRLAHDIVARKDGQLLTMTEEYTELGELWESMGGAWGGRFEDGNHFSVAYRGMR